MRSPAKASYKVSDVNNNRLIECLDELTEVMTEDYVPGARLQPASYADWLTRARSTIALVPDSEKAATARRGIHAALICGYDHTPLERAWTRYREDPVLEALLTEIEALTNDPMYPCPCCSYLTLPELASWCRCPVCGWVDDGTPGGEYGPNWDRTLEVVQETFRSRGDSIPRHLRAPRPEELPPSREPGQSNGR
jgi:hypothetical protein